MESKIFVVKGVACNGYEAYEWYVAAFETLDLAVHYQKKCQQQFDETNFQGKTEVPKRFFDQQNPSLVYERSVTYHTEELMFIKSRRDELR